MPLVLPLEESCNFEVLLELAERSNALLVLCDGAYADFWARNREQLGARFILRRAEELLEERY